MSFLTPRRARRHAAALLVGLWGVTAINFASPGPLSRNGHVKGEDWSHFYAIGRVAARHDGQALYSVEALRSEFAAASGVTEPPTFVPVYGPQLALALAPLGLLPYMPSLLLWWACGALAYGLCCRAAWHRCPHLGSTGDLVLFAAAFPGFWQLFIHGQTTWIALACFTIIWFSLREQRAVPAGIALGLLVYKPQLGVAIVALLLLQRSWAVLAIAALTVAAQVAVCWLWFGGGVFGAYAAMLRALPSIAPLLEPKAYQLCSLRGFFELLALPPPLVTIGAIVSSIGVLAVLAYVRRTRDFDTTFAIALIATVLVGSHVSVYDLVLLAPAFIILANDQVRAPSSRWFWQALYLSYVIALTGPLAALTRVQLAAPVLVALLLATAVPRPQPAAESRPAPV
jgi:hypothetical protein